MTSPTLHEDPIDQLRAERPIVESVMPPRPVAVRRDRRRRYHRRFALAIAAAAVVVLTGVLVVDLHDPKQTAQVGLTSAEAAEIAFDALADLADLTDFEVENVRIDTEVGGEERVDRMSYRVRYEGDNVRVDRSWSSDYLERSSTGIAKLCVDGRCYQHAATTRYPQKWMLEAEPRGSQWAIGAPWPGIEAAPDMATLIERLEREEIASAERDDDGDVRVEFRVPASELAPVGSSMTGEMDLVTSLAGSYVNHGSAVAGDQELTIRIEVGRDGSRRLSSVGRVEHVHPDGNGGTDPLPSELEVAWTWKPVTERELVTPNPSDVLVVGMAGAARKGDTSVYGVHGTLDRFTNRQLEDIAREVRAHRNRVATARATGGRPGRSFPDLWKRQAEQHARVEREIRSWLPLDRAAMSRDERCEPFWPDSLRAMDASEAAEDPDRAGWRCTLSDDRGSFTVMPDSTYIEVRERIGRNGLSSWGLNG